MIALLRASVLSIVLSGAIFVLIGSNYTDTSDHNSEYGLIKDIDGNKYRTVIIGNQTWMAEDLRTTRYNDGAPLLYPGHDNEMWSTFMRGAYAWYDNDKNNKHIYGALYNWYAANSGKLCPAGWHIPSDEEWTELEEHIATIRSDDIGNMLKSCRQKESPLNGDCNTYDHPRWRAHDKHYGTDDFGYAGLPTGVRSSTGEYHALGRYGTWWTSTESSPENAWSRGLDYKFGVLSRTHRYKKFFGFAVRCVKTPDYFDN